MGNCACHNAEPARTERGESAGVEVTIRISKRRLQKLMTATAAGGAHGMTTVEKVLAEIVSAGEVVDGRHRRRRWEPTLQSIPEAVES